VKTYRIEVTDTFGGEANYCWVRRELLHFSEGTGKAQVKRRLKAAMRLTGMPGKWADHGDSLEFRPYGTQTILMARVRY
jgi:hypothetical protein